MERNLNYVSFILHLLILKTSCQISLPPGSHEFYVTEFVRVKRQTGYVYNRPSIPFELPSRPINNPTQEPNVDRTQAQQMYYAYPVPASGQTVNTGYSSGSTSSSSASGSSGGYNYASQSGEGGTSGSQSSNSGTSQNINSSNQASVGSEGYNYGGAAITSNAGQLTNPGSTQTLSRGSSTTSSDASSYRYDAPSSAEGAAQVETQSGFMDNVPTAIKKQLATGYGSDGYDYNEPVAVVGQSDIKSEITGSSFSTTSSGSVGYSSGNPANTAAISTRTNSSPTATSSVSSSYRYDAPSQESSGSNTGIASTSHSQSNQESISSGYGSSGSTQSQNNIAQTSSSISSTQTSTKTGFSQTLSGATSSGYGYNAPSSSLSSTVQSTKSLNTPQASSSSGSTATSSVSTSYRYDSPKISVSNEDSTLTVSTNAPSYLPPNLGASGGTADSTSSVKQPTDLYKPPLNSDVINSPVGKPFQSYIPPPSLSTPVGSTGGKPPQTYVPSSITGPSGSSVSQLSPSYGPPRSNGASAPKVSQPSQAYIPPSVSQQVAIPAVQPSNSYVPSSNPAKAVQQTTYITPSDHGSIGPSYVPPLSFSSVDATVKLSSPTSGLSNGNTLITSKTNYLPPNNFSATVSSGLQVPGQSPNENYIPPSGLSKKQETLFTPSATYLPPVF